MKVFQLLFCSLGILLVSCEKDNWRSELEKSTDQIRGKYECVSMQYEGNPIDLNNDGLCSVDLKDEFSFFSFSHEVFTFPNYIYPASEYNAEEIFSLGIPIQSIKYNTISRKYSLIADLCGSNYYVFFSYSVNQDGTFAFSARNDCLDAGHHRDSDWEILDVDASNTRGEKIISFDDGILTVRIGSLAMI